MEGELIVLKGSQHYHYSGFGTVTILVSITFHWLIDYMHCHWGCVDLRKGLITKRALIMFIQNCVVVATGEGWCHILNVMEKGITVLAKLMATTNVSALLIADIGTLTKFYF